MWPLRPVASPLAAPGSVLAVAGDRRIRLKWPLGSQEDLAGYNVYRSSQGQSSTLESGPGPVRTERSEEHTSELQSPCNLVCRLLLEKKKKNKKKVIPVSIT